MTPFIPHPTSVHELSLSYPRRIFVNRALDLDEVFAIGFDMDYTLCSYRPELEVLATELAIDHLIRRGYPEAMRALRYDPAWATRGLVIDCVRGNLVKMDAHRHVTRAWHGLRRLDDAERREVYHADPPHLSADRWVPLDTLFSTPEAYLYCHIIDLLERDGHTVDSYETRRLYADIRYCIDLVHRDDSLKGRVRADMARYIDRDPLLSQALHRLRSSGKKLFLLTNSDLSYTEAVMDYLLAGQGGYERWQDYFESVWVSAAKPHFFESRDQPFEVNARTFEQGGRRFLEARLGVSGDRILYVGDHIYGDVLKASSTTGWRTALVVPELESEVAALESDALALATRSDLEAERLELESSLAATELELRTVRKVERRLEQARNGGEAPVSAEAKTANPELAAAVGHRDQLRASVAGMRSRVALVNKQIAVLTRCIERHFNPRWGQLLKERHKHSLFGNQMQTYACLYTSSVANFAAYSPNHHFRPPRDLLPHERIPVRTLPAGQTEPGPPSTSEA